MTLHALLRILLLALMLSCIAPAVLLATGVADRDLLLVVFLPSIGVGLASAWFAARRPPVPARWTLDDRRMP